MTTRPENRRVRMTKRLMKDAMLELLEKHELAGISVTAICNTADVHRSTFYKYYSDPVDLLREIEQDFLDRIPSPPKMLDDQNRDKLLSSATDFFEYVKEHERAFRILFRESSGNSFFSRMVEFLCSGYVPVHSEKDEASARFISLYIAYGSVGLMREWVEAGFPFSSREMAKMIFSLSWKISSYGVSQHDAFKI
jgi:AcrR family transcriptional regulator